MDTIAKDKLKYWVSAMRLRTLPLSVSGIIIGASLAHYNGFFSLKIFILAICTTLSLQILSNLANDFGDGLKGTDDNGRIGPERTIQSGKISPTQMFNAIKINVFQTRVFGIKASAQFKQWCDRLCYNKLSFTRPQNTGDQFK